MAGMSPLRIPGAAALALIGALLVSAPAHSADSTRGMQSGPPTKVISNCAQATYKPHKIVSACGDGNEWAYVKEYGSWGAKVAWGHGRLHMNDCEPSCAEGTMRSYPATFRLHRVVNTHRDGALFTRLGVTYMKGGEEHNAELPLPRRALAGRGGAAAGGAPTMAIYDCVHAKVEPRRVVTACGDENAWAYVAQYGSWGARNAWGHGRWHANDCVPDCASGSVRSFPAKFHFHRMVMTGDGDLFTRLGVTYRQDGVRHHATMPLPRHPITTG